MLLKKTFLLVTVVIFTDSFAFSQIIIPVFHPRRGHGETNCTLSEDAVEDYYKIRDFIFTFLENAETDFRNMNEYEKADSCQFAKGNLSELITKGKKDWANCLTDDYAYFGEFVNGTLQNLLDFFCENDNKHVEGYFTEESKQCRADTNKPLFDNCLVSLLAKSHRKINYDLSFNTFLIPGKRDELCRTLLDIGPCTTTLLETHCPHLDYYRQLSAELFAQTMKTCDGYVTYISAARIVGITLTTISIAIGLVVRFCPLRKWYADYQHRITSKTLTNTVI